MNILFDTNVIIDLFVSSDDHISAFNAVDVALLRKFNLWIPACATPSIRYLLTARKLMSQAQARVIFGQLLELFSIIDTTESDCHIAYEQEYRDYEDDLIIASAQRAGMDFIITRNAKDFEKSPIPILTPTAFVDLFKPPNVEYGWVDLVPE